MKDFRRHRIESKKRMTSGELAEEVADKVRDTRECLITLSDLCAEEGETCAAVPADDYALCIHHTNDVGCRDDYTGRKTMYDAESDISVTLCCESDRLKSRRK